MRSRLLAIVVFSIAVLPARAVMFFSTGDPTHNLNTAPTGPLAGSGWQYQGYFGSFLGTAISPKHFITAAHVGTSPTFVSKSFFNGGSDVTYTVDTTFNGGIGYKTLSGTDLRVFQITGTFPAYAPLYTKTDEVGKGLVVVGRGTQRGAEVIVSSELKGWRWGAADGQARWGTNTVSAAVSSGAGDLLLAEFNSDAGGDEAHLSGGDSGGAVFINDGGIWKLAGINFAVEGSFDTNNVVDTNEFEAALFDMGGLYIGRDTPSPDWTFIPDLATDIPSQFAASRISSSVGAILAIPEVGALIPEPENGALLLVASSLLFRRRRGRPLSPM
ncbi:MAG: trypsin-like serine protease [Verrucomicrobiales bacterium]